MPTGMKRHALAPKPACVNTGNRLNPSRSRARMCAEHWRAQAGKRAPTQGGEGEVAGQGGAVGADGGAREEGYLGAFALHQSRVIDLGVHRALRPSGGRSRRSLQPLLAGLGRQS